MNYFKSLVGLLMLIQLIRFISSYRTAAIPDAIDTKEDEYLGECHIRPMFLN